MTASAIPTLDYLKGLSSDEERSLAIKSMTPEQRAQLIPLLLQETRAQIKLALANRHTIWDQRHKPLDQIELTEEPPHD